MLNGVTVEPRRSLPLLSMSEHILGIILSSRVGEVPPDSHVRAAAWSPSQPQPGSQSLLGRGPLLSITRHFRMGPHLFRFESLHLSLCIVHGST